MEQGNAPVEPSGEVEIPSDLPPAHYPIDDCPY